VTLLDEPGVDEWSIMRTPQGAIVVGVDGSDQALKAAEWAFQEALLRQRPVHLVSGVVLDLYEALLPPMDHAVLLDLAREALLDAEARAPQGFDLPVTRELVGQAPARVLVEASEVADLIVVGTRGHGGFVGMLLGSVSQHVSRHAHCGVAVVRPTAESAPDDVVAGIDMSHRDPVVLRTAFECQARPSVQADHRSGSARSVTTTAKSERGRSRPSSTACCSRGSRTTLTSRWCTRQSSDIRSRS
jgi:nucleotide-binding universal stress UspA family protein